MEPVARSMRSNGKADVAAWSWAGILLEDAMPCQPGSCGLDADFPAAHAPVAGHKAPLFGVENRVALKFPLVMAIAAERVALVFFAQLGAVER